MRNAVLFIPGGKATPVCKQRSHAVCYAVLGYQSGNFPLSIGS